MKMKPISKTKDVCLVQMPIGLTTVPMLSLSLFKALLNEKGISSVVIYNNLRFLEKFEPRDCFFIERSPMNHLMGEFIFSKAVGWETAKDAEDYRKNLKDTYNYKYLRILPQFEFFWDRLPEMQEKAAKFVSEAVDEVLCFKPKIVGCASMFQQNLASLAFLRQVKERKPGITTLLGGSNCMGEASIAMAESMTWLDYLFSGEADEIFADFCAKILSDGANIPEAELPYGVIKKGMRLNRSKPYRVSADLEKLPIPDYSDYFEALENSPFKDSISPGLIIEGSRGCWWGEKKPCSFCGLGGLSHKYRQKSAAKILADIKELSEKYTINKFLFTDSIMSMKHIEELTPELIELNASKENNYTFFIEIKSNISEKQVKNLKEAGFSWLQPGIESIQDDFLKAMNKGNKGIKHIEFLKYCRTYCIHIVWNMLIGVPLENKEWIDQITELIPLITHLPPPQYFARRISYQKHSVYVENQKEYGLNLQPVEAYSYIYPDKGIFEGMLEKIAYLFEPVSKSERDEYYEVSNLEQHAALSSQVESWNEKFYLKRDAMTMRVYDDKVEIIDFRSISQKNFITLTGIEKEVYLGAENVISKKELGLQLKDRFDFKKVEQTVEKLCQDKLMLEINGEVLALANKPAKYYYRSLDDFPLGRRQ